MNLFFLSSKFKRFSEDGSSERPTGEIISSLRSSTKFKISSFLSGRSTLRRDSNCKDIWLEGEKIISFLKGDRQKGDK